MLRGERNSADGEAPSCKVPACVRGDGGELAMGDGTQGESMARTHSRGCSAAAWAFTRQQARADALLNCPVCIQQMSKTRRLQWTQPKKPSKTWALVACCDPSSQVVEVEVIKEKQKLLKLRDTLCSNHYISFRRDFSKFRVKPSTLGS